MTEEQHDPTEPTSQEAPAMILEQVKLSDLADWLNAHKLRVVSSSWAPGSPAPIAELEHATG